MYFVINGVTTKKTIYFVFISEQGYCADFLLLSAYRFLVNRGLMDSLDIDGITRWIEELYSLGYDFPCIG